MTKKLSPKQQRFVEEYLIDLNATQAYRRAGYSVKSEAAAAVEGHKLLRNPKIAKAIQEGMDARSERTQVTADRVLQELARIGFADPRMVMSWGPNGVVLRDSSELTEDEAAIVSEVSETRTESGGSLKVKLNDKLSALEKLGKHLDLFKERHEHTGKDGRPIEVQHFTPDQMARIYREAADAIESRSE